MPANNTSTERSPRRKSIKSNQLKNRPSVKRKKGLGLHLCDLPTEILERIIGNVHIWHRKRIRATCKRLRNVCDNVLMHQFKLFLQKYERRSKTYQHISLTVVHQATWAYVKAGYRPFFVNTVMPLMRDNYPFRLMVIKIKQFLMKFYTFVEENLRDPYSQTSRLLYTVTFLGFMHKCKNSTLLSSLDIGPGYWQAVFEFQGSWLKRFHCFRSSRSFSYSADRKELLILLAEIMLSVNSETAFKNACRKEDQRIMIDHDSQRTDLPRTIFTFDVCGTSEVLSFLKTAASTSDWNSLPKGDFSLRLNIRSTEGSKWGFSRFYQLEILSDSDAEKNWNDTSETLNYLYNLLLYPGD